MGASEAMVLQLEPASAGGLLNHTLLGSIPRTVVSESLRRGQKIRILNELPGDVIQGPHFKNHHSKSLSVNYIARWRWRIL
jgi:hypothetical protein